MPSASWNSENCKVHMTSNKVIYTYWMTENTRTLCASLNLQRSAIEKAPVTGAMSAASQTQAPHWYKVCRTWARWKRCSPAGSRTATALSQGRRRHAARHESGDDAALGRTRGLRWALLLCSPCHFCRELQSYRPIRSWRSWYFDCTLLSSRVKLEDLVPPFRARPCLVGPKLLNLTLCKKEIPRHIKLVVHVWSTKCWRNQKLIAQFGCTLRDERFESN